MPRYFIGARVIVKVSGLLDRKSEGLVRTVDHQVPYQTWRLDVLGLAIKCPRLLQTCRLSRPCQTTTLRGFSGDGGELQEPAMLSKRTKSIYSCIIRVIIESWCLGPPSDRVGI
jgi:hypothetical protein